MNFNCYSARSEALVLGFLIGALALVALPSAAQEQADAVETKRAPAQVMSYRGWQWLERKEREEEERPYEVLKAMGLKAGDFAADIGCGTGWYARKMAKIVGKTGRVYGVDIQPKMLSMMNALSDEEGVSVIPVYGSVTDTRLPKGEIDWMILADVYHEFEDPGTMLASMLDALKPGGKVALLEYRLLGETGKHIKIDHRMSVDQVKSEWIPAGFDLVKIHEFLPSQHLFIFQKPVKKDE
jgi:predicted methyltransferase